MSSSGKTGFIGAKGASFERVKLAFQVYGYTPPTPDIEGGEGAFVSNIINQYQADLTPAQVQGIIEYGLGYSRDYLEQTLREKWEPTLTVKQLGDVYTDRHSQL